MSILELKNVTKHYGKFKAIDNVSFSIQPGEVYGFIGPNGAGKSTTLRTIIGAIKRSSGEIYFDGKDIEKFPKYIENISYVPGDVNLWPNLTGMEVINFFMKVKGFTDTNRRDELIAKFALDPHKKCKTYSKGNKQKVALISAFCSNATLLIFDEPTTGLDPLMERNFHTEVKRAKEEGKAILLSSHILSEVEKLADRISIIKEGRIIESGNLEDLKHITRLKYIVETKDSMEEIFDKPYVHDVNKKNGQYHLLVDNDSVVLFLKDLRNVSITHLETEPPKLEDIFMRYYEVHK